MKELIILGQGPAGISAALYAVRGGARVTVIAKDYGALAKADKIENYYGFENGILAKDLIQAGIQQAKNLGVKFIQAEVCGIEFGENGYDIKTSNHQTFHAVSIVIAVGTSRNTPKIENLQAFEGKGISYCAICDGFFFRGKKVGVIGNAAYAFSEYSVLKNIIDDVTILTDGKQPAFSSANYNPKKIQKFEGNETSLFLTEMNRGKKYTVHSKLLFFRDVYDWIQNHIIVITPNTPLIDLEYYYDMDSLKSINKLIETFDTGISKVKIEEISLDELSNAMPKVIFDRVMHHVKSRMEEQENSSFRMTMRSNENFFNIEVKGDLEPKVTTIRLNHIRSFYDFGFEEESDGTRRLFDLMDMLLNKREDVLYVVDELERSLHPKLTKHFLQMFMELHKEKRMQLLFTTHESSIMDQSIFRRDEIWFIERNAENVSVIYSLDRFKERYDKVLSKAYLEGRYGAIPVFRTFEFREEE